MRLYQRHATGNQNGQVEKDLERARSDGNARPAVAHASLKTRISHFTWAWFASTMATGSLASVLGQTPYRFRGLSTIGTIFYILDITLFVTLSIMMCVRFVIAPSKLRASLHHPVEGLFFGTFWVSVALILNCMELYGVPSSGPWLVSALEVLFWLYCALVLLVAIFQYYVFFQDEKLKVADAMPAWIFPIYPLLIVGVMAGSFVKSQPERAAYTMWVGAVMMQGLAWLVSFMMYTIYTQRLMSSSLPAPSSRPGMYVSVGPAGYTATAVISLATAAPKVMSAIAFDHDTTFADGEIVKIIGYMLGTFLILFGFWFFCISTVAVIAGIRRMSFTLPWWAFIFPNAGLNLAIIQLGKVYQSSAINWIASVVTVLLVIMWFVTAIANVRAVWKRQIMWPGKDEDQDMGD